MTHASIAGGEVGVGNEKQHVFEALDEGHAEPLATNRG